MFYKTVILSSARSYIFRKEYLCRTIDMRFQSSKAEEDQKPISPRVAEFRKKLREKTPIGKLDELDRHPYEEKEPLKPWPNNTNPHTGEIGGPKGPEPTRYGDWERKGKVSDF